MPTASVQLTDCVVSARTYDEEDDHEGHGFVHVHFLLICIDIRTGEPEVAATYAVEFHQSTQSHYILLTTKEEQEKWIYYINRACIALPTITGTETEQILSSIPFDKGADVALMLTKPV